MRKELCSSYVIVPALLEPYPNTLNARKEKEFQKVSKFSFIVISGPGNGISNAQVISKVLKLFVVLKKKVMKLLTDPTRAEDLR